MAAIFGETKIVFKIGMATLQITCGSKFLLKSLYLARFSRYKHFYVLQFLRKIRKFKMAAIFGETKIVFKIGMATLQITCGSKLLLKSLYLARFSRYKHFYVLQYLRKIRKFKIATIFGEDKFFFLNWEGYSAYPVGQKFEIKAFLCFAIFAKISKIQNGCHFWREQNF